MSVRAARIEDLPAITRLFVMLRDHHRVLQPENPRYQVADQRWEEIAQRALKGDDVAIYVAEEDGAVRGFVKLAIVEKPWGPSCQMDTLVVDEGWRSKGIGNELLAAAERHATKVGAKTIRADVLTSNNDGRAFYEREGYSVLSVRYGKTIGR